MTDLPPLPRDDSAESSGGLFAVGGLLAAIGASSCCVLPMALFSLGLGGAWAGFLTSFAPYQWIFAAVALTCLAAGFVFHLRSRNRVCAVPGRYMSPVRRGLVLAALGTGTILLSAAMAFPFFLSLAYE